MNAESKGCALAAEALKLERTLSDLVNQAYALPPAEIDLLCQTAPDRYVLTPLPICGAGGCMHRHQARSESAATVASRTERPVLRTFHRLFYCLSGVFLGLTRPGLFAKLANVGSTTFNNLSKYEDCKKISMY